MFNFLKIGSKFYREYICQDIPENSMQNMRLKKYEN